MTASSGTPLDPTLHGALAGGDVDFSGPGEYLALSERLKQLRGVDFETHGHPAVVLDRATAPSTRVWGWWAEAEPPVPCLMWASERGWSATVVEPGALDTEGYERAFWSHRINLLDLALANALGPFPTIEHLELRVAAECSFGAGVWAAQLRIDVLWGIVQLRAARAGAGRSAVGVRAVDVVAQCRVDQELARYALVPMLAKSRWSPEVPQRGADAGAEALLRAVRRAAERTGSSASSVRGRPTISPAGAGTPRSGRPGGSPGAR